ncbi:hypothetical protein ACLKA6_005431 [Drosophila palustris]
MSCKITCEDTKITLSEANHSFGLVPGRDKKSFCLTLAIAVYPVHAKLFSSQFLMTSMQRNLSGDGNPMWETLMQLAAHMCENKDESREKPPKQYSIYLMVSSDDENDEETEARDAQQIRQLSAQMNSGNNVYSASYNTGNFTYKTPENFAEASFPEMWQKKKKKRISSRKRRNNDQRTAMDYRGGVSRQPSVEESAHCTEDNEDSDVETVTDREESHQEEYVNFRDNSRVDDYPRDCRERNGHSQPPEFHKYPERRELSRREIPKQVPESQPKRGTVDPFKLMRHSIVLRSDYVKHNLSQFSQTQGMGLNPNQRQASGHSGCDPCDSRKIRKDKEPPNYRQQTCCDPKSKYRDDFRPNHSCNSCYDTPLAPKKSPKKKASCESCCAAPFKPRPQPSSECCCAPPPSKPRQESRDKSYCEEPPPRPRREPKQCDFYSEAPAKPRREPQSRPRHELQPNSSACCACVRPAPPQPRPSPSQCSCSKTHQRGYAPSKRNSDYTEYKEFKPPICRNPLVVRSRVGIPSTSKQGPSTSCPAYKERPQRSQVFCECGPSKQSKPKPQPSQPPSRPTREYCTNSAPADYMENQPSSGLFTRNSLTCTSYNVKINSCPRQAKPPSNSNETLNERKLRCQRYCNPPRPKCPSKEPPRKYELPRKCKRCNKSKVRPRKDPSTRNSCVHFQESPFQFDDTCYVPPTCFAPTTCPAKRKRSMEARRGRSCSGFTVKPTNSIQRTRRTLNNKCQCAAHNTHALCGIRPMVRGHRSVLKVRLSGCGVNRVGSKMLMGSGYKMIPFPALTKLNMNRRIPKLKPSTFIYPRCRGGKLSPTSTRVPKSRQTNSQRLNSANSLATARTSPRRISESRRDRSQQQQGHVPTASYGSTRTPQSTVRRDLPQRYQPASHASNRPVQVTEEVSHPVPRRSHNAGPAPQITRQQSAAQATTKSSSNRAQEVERAPVATASRGHAVKKSVSIRLKEPSNHAEEKGHAFPSNKAQEEERAPAQDQSRSGSVKVSEAGRPSQNQPSPIRVQEGAGRPSQKQSVSGRVKESGRSSPQNQSQGHSRSGSNRVQEAAHTEAGLALPNRDHEKGRSPGQAQSQAPAFLNKVNDEGKPTVRSQSRGPTISTRAAEQITEKPQYSGSAQNQPETALENDNHQFYRGSFLTIRSPMPNEIPNQSSSRPHGSLIMIAQNGLQPQILKRSIPKGSSFIVPNKWQCMGKMNGFVGINSFMDIGKSVEPDRHSWNWRKLCPNWLLNGKSRTT